MQMENMTLQIKKGAQCHQRKTTANFCWGWLARSVNCSAGGGVH